MAVDATLVSADADVGPLLARDAPAVHEVRLVALAFVRDLAPSTFDPGAALFERPSGGCTCGEATHFAGATKYGATLSYGFTSGPRPEAHVGALDLVRAALGDPNVTVREERVGAMTIDGLAPLLASAGRATGASARLPRRSTRRRSRTRPPPSPSSATSPRPRCRRRRSTSASLPTAPKCVEASTS